MCDCLRGDQTFMSPMVREREYVLSDWVSGEVIRRLTDMLVVQNAVVVSRVASVPTTCTHTFLSHQPLWLQNSRFSMKYLDSKVGCTSSYDILPC